jgi:biotin synthase
MNTREALELAEAIGEGYRPETRVLEELAATPERRVWDILPGANMLRERAFGNGVHLCAILNGKSGKCGEDCAFCAQSARAKTGAPVYPLVSGEEIRDGALYAAGRGIHRFSVVTSGGRLPAREVEAVAASMAELADIKGLSLCASLGALGPVDFAALRKAGITRYHHNLETAESFFPHICTTHTWAERIKTIENARDAGMSVCAGGLFGLGETDAQVLELALALRDLDVDSAPVNFLIPIPGTRLEKASGVSPLRCLKIIALLRYVLPEKEIVVCGGRVANLGDLHPLVFFAGAGGVMTGNYLTAKGRVPEDDMRMLCALGMEPRAARRGNSG